VWLTDDGRVLLADPPAPGEPGVRDVARWALAPFAWRDVRAGAGERLAAVRARARALLPRAEPPRAGVARVAGYLHAEAGPGRVALLAAQHPITGDLLLSTQPSEAGDLGYGAAVPVGHLDAVAPVTGTLGVQRRPRLEGASRFGQRVRPW
jgi:hypothetical protein